jgi:hypothetical protein
MVREMVQVSGQHLKKLNHVFLVIFSVFFLVGWTFHKVEGASGERDPFALPAGVQKGRTTQKKEGAGPAKTGQESAQGFRVTTILVSGRTKVAGINGVLRQKGDEVMGYRIMEIEEKQVTLSRGKEKLVLKIDPEVGYSFKKLNPKTQNMGFSK